MTEANAAKLRAIAAELDEGGQRLKAQRLYRLADVQERASCPPTPEVDLLCTQLNTAEAERDAARRESEDRAVGIAIQFNRAERLQAELDALRAMVDAVRAYLAIDDELGPMDCGDGGSCLTWADANRQEVAIDALRAALGAVGGSLVGPKPVGAPAATSNSSPLILDVAGPVVALPEPTEQK